MKIYHILKVKQKERFSKKVQKMLREDSKKIRYKNVAQSLYKTGLITYPRSR